MKRRTKQNVGAWPNMRDDTLKAIAGELARARKKHPAKRGNLFLLVTATASLEHELDENTAGKIAASQIYARAAQVAALAIRVLEEGAAEHRYAGNVTAPEFKLEAQNDGA